ncbi:MAG TPA: DUF6596 domain-containing protein [Puia sp.]|nr:DUF6596 domain-containing protein [Puia sp.]
MENSELIPHLFRTEFSKIVAVLCRRFGIEHLETAEDLAGETFLAALETWPYKGVPKNPEAWLYTVAKNKASNYVQRRNLFTGKIANQLKSSSTSEAQLDIDLSKGNITDSQLQMLFAVCHPVISAEAQIGLALRVLCGFGLDEIANAFLTNKETIAKRLFRAKEKLRSAGVQMEFPSGDDITLRLENVLRTLYLLFNEGYYSESSNAILREDLCLEAMRLTNLLLENEPTNRPEVRALFSLMCFHASRFGARRDEQGEMILYQDQDESRWNYQLIEKGAWFLLRASEGEKISKYHLEAGIAYWHTVKEDTAEKWNQILQCYNRLLQLEYSPIAALNRTFALSKVAGKQEAIAAAEKLDLQTNYFYFVLLGELYTGLDDEKAYNHLERACELAKTQTDKQNIRKKMEKLPVYRSHSLKR